MISFLRKLKQCTFREVRFLLQQKWGLVSPTDVFAISKSVLKKYLPADAVIIDCGAHVGDDSVEFAKVFPRSVIHSFEPVPSVFESLRFNTKAYKNITCHQLALSNSNSFAKMYVSSGNSDASSSLLEPGEHLNDHPEIYFDNTVEVQTFTLDQWAENNGINKVDFLWLDMQGFEYTMLAASSRILPTVKAIFTEVSLKQSYKEAVQYKDFKHWLEVQGFTAVKEFIPAGADMGNVLFVRN